MTGMLRRDPLITIHHPHAWYCQLPTFGRRASATLREERRSPHEFSARKLWHHGTYIYYNICNGQRRSRNGRGHAVSIVATSMISLTRGKMMLRATKISGRNHKTRPAQGLPRNKTGGWQGSERWPFKLGLRDA